MNFINNFALYKYYFQPVLDIILLAFIIYTFLNLLIKTKATYLISGIGVFLTIYAVAYIFNLSTNLWLLEKLATVLVIILVVVFQSELKKIFNQIGRGNFFFFKPDLDKNVINEIYVACKELSNKKRGALIIMEQSVGLKNLTGTATVIDAEVSSKLLLSIFEFDSALHDGAVVIKKGRIASASVFCELSEQSEKYASTNLGTRHRAAIGVTENSDAIVFVVSEETGAISIAYQADLRYNLTTEEINDFFRSIYSEENNSNYIIDIESKVNSEYEE